jgi:hypothetical protein
MVVNDDAGNLTPLRRPQVHREQARSYRKRSGNKKPDNFIGRVGQAGR